MREGEPSRTAYAAAAQRAVHQDLEGGRVFRDPLAWRVLEGDRAQVVAEAPARSRLRMFVAARHRFAEDALAAAVARGTRQVVVLGAGLDTTAYRWPGRDVRFWEVDAPATQAWKRDLLGRVGVAVPATVAYVPVDLESEPLLPALAVAGVDLGRPVFVPWLGVVPYLTHDATTATLRALGTVPGAEVVLDYAGPRTPDEEESSGRARLAARVAALGEPLAEPWEPEELHAVCRGAGFDEVDDLDRAAIRTRILGRGEGAGGGSGAGSRAGPGAGERRGGAHLLRGRRT